ncbi:MAG: biotin--[acetyl-CoA-carboxylase] ligase [Prevotellaceae bacterium]|jgi:BirA family biotin operon repressor/biotin-[acetyl-CoA-carboxylase] ligase|nr:biotin--[acetyl-CoA-carboxylase] ligase [Prevotellaceae bacterium]
MSIIHLKETASTNEYLKQLLEKEEPQEGTIVVADYQTAGKGQVENAWESEAGKNLLFSLLLRPDFLEAEDYFAVTEIVSLAIREVLLMYLKDNVTIKWANDIYWRNKKIAGILIENNIMEDKIVSSVIGIGLNVNQKEFKSDAPNPISLKDITGNSYVLKELLQKIQLAILRYYVMLMEDGFEAVHGKYLNALYRKEGFYNYEANGEIFSAVLVDVEKSGLLKLEDKHYKTMTFDFKEVKFV